MSETIRTQDLFEQFFNSSYATDYDREHRVTVDRQDIYDFEESIGKRLVEMNEDEIIEMYRSLKNRGFQKGNLKPHIQNSVNQINSMLRKIINFYNEVVVPNSNGDEHIIINQFNKKNLSVKKITEVLNQDYDTLTWSDVEDLINMMRMDKSQYVADCVECAMRLYYHGFSSVEKIMMMKEEDIDHEKKTVITDGTVKQLSDKSYELLVKIHKMDEIPKYRGVDLMLAWHGGYYKVPVQKNCADWFQDQTAYEAGKIINQQIRSYFQKPYDTALNGLDLYFLGFYDYMVLKTGKKEANRIIRAKKDLELTPKFHQYLAEYGIPKSKADFAKNHLIMFLDDSESDPNE